MSVFRRLGKVEPSTRIDRYHAWLPCLASRRSSSANNGKPRRRSVTQIRDFGAFESVLQTISAIRPLRISALPMNRDGGLRTSRICSSVVFTISMVARDPGPTAVLYPVVWGSYHGLLECIGCWPLIIGASGTAIPMTAHEVQEVLHGLKGDIGHGKLRFLSSLSVVQSGHSS